MCSHWCSGSNLVFRPLKAAAHLSIPVLLIHGDEDHESSPTHSERVYKAVAGPKRLVLLPKTRLAQGTSTAVVRAGNYPGPAEPGLIRPARNLVVFGVAAILVAV
jgi:fermentation-respiration switch protein FrsA (DUF1100 family)